MKQSSMFENRNMGMKSFGLVLLFFCLMTQAVFAQLRHGDPAIRVVNTDEVNVRTQPRTGPNTFVTKVKRGTMLKRLGERAGWYQILLPDGREAWIFGRYAEEVEARDLLEVTKATVNVRSSPTTASRRVDTVKQGDMLSLERERNGWFYAILADGKRGWVREDMVRRHPLSPPEVPTQTAPPAEEEKAPEPPKPKPIDYYKQAKDLAEDGNSSEAIEAFQKALEGKPDDANIHFDLAKTYKNADQLDDALTHFRRARQLGGRDEAKFYIEDILKARAAKADETPEAVVEGDVDEGEGVEEGEPFDVASIMVFVPWAAVGSVIFAGVLGLVIWRRRKALQPDQPTVRRRNQDAGFDSVLKYAVEKRPLFRAIEEAERKRSELDETLQQRLAAFGGNESPRLPSGESSDALLKKIEDLRQVIVNQEERAQIYADLIVLQNEKLAALDEEVDALKKLIQIDYQEGAAKKKAGQDKATG